jgi:hypothetical protein
MDGSPLPSLPYIYTSLSPPFSFLILLGYPAGIHILHVQYKNNHKCSLISNAKRDTRRRTLGSRRHTHNGRSVVLGPDSIATTGEGEGGRFDKDDGGGYTYNPTNGSHSNKL